MYALRNTNKAETHFLMTKYAIVLVIMDMAWAKSDVNGPNKKGMFLYVTPKHKKEWF